MTTPQIQGKQAQALDKALSICDGGELYVGGVAGSGKTFTLVECYDRIMQNESCIVLTPTNKAAQVLRNRGVPAQTIHSFMYHIVVRLKRDEHDKLIIDPQTGQPEEELVLTHILDLTEQDEDEIGKDLYIPDVLLIDECSMVGGRLYHDLKRFQHDKGTNLIFFGDAFQLPPVKDQIIFQNRAPDVFLDEVHRVVANNPVLKYADFIRNNPYGVSYPNWQDFERYSIASTKVDEAVRRGAQFISWTNKTRNSINEMAREVLGHRGMLPEAGEPLIVLNNLYERNLFNGMFVECIHSEDVGINSFRCKVKELDNNGGKEHMLVVWRGPPFSQPGEFKKSRGMAELDFAYCITAHKSQGSEWEHIVVLDQRRMMRGELESMRQSWFYTAITRTRDTLEIIK